ncbi:hypothetical protein FACS189450_15030 [Spirochaetia bacterium]|nr:hypothetical protein FACS189450_15030 [Spirochaetia bacterium]
MDFYASYNFIQEDGTLNLVPSPQIFTNILLRYGLKQDNTYQELNGGVFTAYPMEYFCPKSLKTGQVLLTDNTYSIHHYAGSWILEKEKKYQVAIFAVYKIFGNTFIAKIFVAPIVCFRHFREEGFIGMIQYLIYKKKPKINS